MRPLRLVLGIVGATLLMVWLGAWSATATQRSESLAFPQEATTTVWDAEPLAGEVAPFDRVVDRYGNRVDRAVTDYRIDHRGDVYERHSPHTAVPRLGPPIG